MFNGAQNGGDYSGLEDTQSPPRELFSTGRKKSLPRLLHPEMALKWPFETTKNRGTLRYFPKNMQLFGYFFNGMLGSIPKTHPTLFCTIPIGI